MKKLYGNDSAIFVPKRAGLRFAIICALGGVTTGVFAQESEQASAPEIEEVVVTGSSIRGIPPTGSNMIQLGQEAVIESGAATTQELMATVPQLGTFNEAPRPDPHSNGILSTAPNIRGIGQAQTLVLINGHRSSGTGHLQSISDPSIVPPSAIERVEVVADGASSIYGSDGIAGVVNVITLREYEGFQGAIRKGAGDNYELENVNFVTGGTWDRGGIMLSVESAENTRLEGFDRSYVTNDFSAIGGEDQRRDNGCIPSQFQLEGSGDYISYGTGERNAHCDTAGYTDLYPEQRRLSFFSAGHQEFTDNVEVFWDAYHSETTSDANLQPRYRNGTMNRSHPYFPTEQVDALDPTVDEILTHVNISEIAGVRLHDKQKVRVFGATLGSEVGIGEFQLTSYVTGSRSFTDLWEGGHNDRAIQEAFASTDPDNAIDPFTGMTSDYTKVSIVDQEQFFGSEQYMYEFNSVLDGPLFEIAGGTVRGALGGVYRHEFYDGLMTLSRIGFRENPGTQVGTRDVYSAFGELFIPVIGFDNALPGVQSLDVSLSARIDDYSDFGQTTNPKIGLNWGVNDSLGLRASYGTSFAAPMLPDIYGPDTRGGYGIGGNPHPGIDPTPNRATIWIAGGNPNLQPEEATTWSVGFDYTPEQLPGLNASMTYYDLAFEGRIYYPNSGFFNVIPEFREFFLQNVQCTQGEWNGIGSSASGCTEQPIDPALVYGAVEGLRIQGFPNEVNGPQDLPDVHFVSILRRANLDLIDTTGIDFDIGYLWDTNVGNIRLQLQGNRILSYDQAAIDGATLIDQFPFGQQKLKMRGALSWTNGPMTAALQANYSGEYKDQYVAVDSAGIRTQGVETIDKFVAFDLHFRMDLQEYGLGFGESTQLTLDVDNLFDEEPPLARSGFGFGNGNVLGRVLTIGVRQAF